MDIYRQKDGVYHCINNPAKKCKYVLIEAEGCYPTFVPIVDSAAADQQLYRAAVPIPCFLEKDNKKK